MTTPMSPEEAFAHALIHYINSKPAHAYGLCSWLSDQSRFLGTRFQDAYSLTSRARNQVPKIDALFANPNIEYNTYVAQVYASKSDKAASPKRIKLAQLLLAELESGRMRYVQREHASPWDWEA